MDALNNSSGEPKHRIKATTESTPPQELESRARRGSYDHKSESGAFGYARVTSTEATHVCRSKRDTLKSKHDTSLLSRQARSHTIAPAEAKAATLQEALALFSYTYHGVELGSGGFGTVYKFTTESNEAVAIKKINLKYHKLLQPFDKGEILGLVLEEHPNLVKTRGIVARKKDSDSYILITDVNQLTKKIKSNYLIEAIISDLAPGEELWDFLNPPFTRTNQFIASALFDVSAALMFLHEKGIVYRDLKPENIHVSKDAEGYKFKLLDYGFMKKIDTGRTHSPDGTIVYMAEEVLDCKGKKGNGNGYGYPCDAWSLGCLMLEMITNKLIVNYNKAENNFSSKEDRALSEDSCKQKVSEFGNMDSEKKIQMIKKAKYSTLRDHVDPTLLEVTAKLLEQNPDNRITIKEANRISAEFLQRQGA